MEPTNSAARHSVYWAVIHKSWKSGFKNVHRSISTSMSNSTNSSSDQTLQFICAFPVSGQYGKTVRFLIYPLIVLSTLYRTSPWLAGGCLTTIFTYCVVASIHSSAMATFHSSSVLDLDCFVAFHLCVIGLIVSPGVIQQATSLRVRSRKFVFSMFIILLWTGLVSFAATARYHPLPQACQNTTGPVNVNDTWAIGSCTGRCSQYTLPMRSGQSAQNVVYEGFFYAHKDRVAIIMACLLTFWIRHDSTRENRKRFFACSAAQHELL